MKYKKAELKPDEKACLELRGLYEQYGYKKYKMSKFEEYSLYVENKDFLASDKVITFTDLDGRLLALKPDVTLSIIKNTQATFECNEKLYYIENVYRESRESHTFKEISQMGLEYIGKVDAYCITEVIALAAKSLRAISKDYILEVAHMSFVVELLQSLQVAEHTKLKLLTLIRSKNVDGLRRTAERADLSELQVESLCRLPFLYGDVTKTIREAKKISLNKAMDRSLDELAQVYEALKALGLAKNIQVDLSIVNDIDYYNGIIFKGYIKELGRCVLAGGQYDQAMALLGKKVDAIGFALYLNEINRIAEEKVLYDVDAVIIYSCGEDVVAVARAVQELQKEGLSVRAEKAVPPNVRYRELYRLENGLLKKEETSC
ncbi:ATP phosphoribosyltransferase regulatory subunit [Anaerovorax odorimutans]|uniref:ATP phosphoribosyltransferase regulatory subunit n=1 Tax=Anaerovorax odorimutans TaxID=109327 RepID=A0ABT1RU88_9FIRM|nr:ATP phosphoribosyltransferase regulatory subunit [Anaerovorax odorimutans]MCQ4638411.1 ATP phosphoribosyltransferase regulatory subunit [Anaerovorax odorimutans]